MNCCAKMTQYNVNIVMLTVSSIIMVHSYTQLIIGVLMSFYYFKQSVLIVNGFEFLKNSTIMPPTPDKLILNFVHKNFTVNSHFKITHILSTGNKAYLQTKPSATCHFAVLVIALPCNARFYTVI